MAHIHEKIDFTVDVFIVHNGKVLLRYHDKYNFWGVPGGHIELDEDPVQAAHREVMEEAGLKVSFMQISPCFYGKDGDIMPPAALHRHSISDTHEHVSLVYFAFSDSNNVKPHQDEKEVEMRWCSLKDLDSMDLRDNIRHYARCALDAARANIK